MSLLQKAPEKGEYMQIYTKGVDFNEVLFFVPETDSEGEILTDFARPDEPLVAVLKKDRGYRYPHLEVRKEST